MKRILLIAAIILVLIIFTACREEVSRELYDYRFTPAHYESVIDYEYVWIDDNYTRMPYSKLEWRNDKYELGYHVTYDDDSVGNIWVAVTQREYDNAVKELNGD